MKRKFKLFATIASLCLCLALMAFGVYAASTVKYTASGSVSFTVSDVFVTMTSKLEATVSGKKSADVDDSQKSYTGGEDEAAKVPSATTEYSKPFEAVAFTKTGDNIILTVTITNDGASKVKVKFTVTKPADETAGITSSVAYKKGEAPTEYTEAGIELSNKESAVVVLTITLANMENAVESTPYSVVADVAKA